MTTDEKYEKLAKYPLYAEAAMIYWKIHGRSDHLPPPTHEEIKAIEAEAIAELEKIAKSFTDKQLEFMIRLAKYIEDCHEIRMAGVLLGMKQQKRKEWIEEHAARA